MRQLKKKEILFHIKAVPRGFTFRSPQSLFNGSIPTRFLMICYNFGFHQSQIHYRVLPQTNPR